MSEFGNVFVFMLGATLILMLVQTGVNEINPNAHVFIKCSDTIINSFSVGGNCSNLNTGIAFSSDSNPSKPTTTESVSNGFTDIFNAIQSWFLTGFGATYLGSVLLAPYLLLGLLGASATFSFFIGSVWYIFVFFSFIEWWRGI